MPDLTEQTFWLCETAENFQVEVEGSKGTYQVTYGRNHLNPNVIFDWACTCPQYQFRKKYCKHILKASLNYCGWNQLVNGGEPVNGKCPNCGGNVIARKTAV